MDKVCRNSFRRQSREEKGYILFDVRGKSALNLGEIEISCAGKFRVETVNICWVDGVH